jgi:hypothetical protein
MSSASSARQDRTPQPSSQALSLLVEPTGEVAAAWRQAAAELLQRARYKSIALVHTALGHTTAAAELSMALGQRGASVCLAECFADTLPTLFAVLQSQEEMGETPPVQQVYHNVWLLSNQHSQRCFLSKNKHHMLVELQSRFAFVLYETLGAKTASEHLHIEALCDGVIFLVDTQTASRRVLEQYLAIYPRQKRIGIICL